MLSVDERTSMVTNAYFTSAIDARHSMFGCSAISTRRFFDRPSSLSFDATGTTRMACCNEITACAQDDECVALIYMCIDGMGCAPGTPCFANCRKQWPSGAKIFDKLDACSSTVNCP